MIQRIQTLYLLAATALFALFFFSPLATFTTAEGIFSLSVRGIFSVDGSSLYSMIYMVIITALALVLPFVNIFLFKNRMLQLRLCVVEIVLSVGVLIIGGIYYHLANRFFGGSGSELISASPRVVCVLPLVAIYFTYRALRAILKDEMLIKSLDRIR